MDAIIRLAQEDRGFAYTLLHNWNDEDFPETLKGLLPDEGELEKLFDRESDSVKFPPELAGALKAYFLDLVDFNGEYLMYNDSNGETYRFYVMDNELEV